jgi:hypothetical protein
MPTICNSSIKATLKTGSGLSGSVGSITSATFTNCRWVLGYIMTLKATDLPWPLSAQSYDARSISVMSTKPAS